MSASLQNRILSVLSAYGLALLGAAIGAALRLFGLFERPLAPYHCYDWLPQTAMALSVYLLIAPLAAGWVEGRVRALAICAIGIIALVLATFLWSYTRIVSCSPL